MTLTNPIDELIEKLNDKASFVESLRERELEGALYRQASAALSTLQEQNRKLEEVLAELLAAPPVVEVFGPQVTDCECPFCRARALLSGGGE